MKILQIKLKNFRPFFSTQEINFSVSEKKPVTVIYAGNGVGKTTIINAITWCLYGEELHKLKGKEVGVINDTAKTKLKPGEVDDVQVEIFLGEGEKTSVFFSRTLSFTKNNDGSLKILPPFDGRFVAKILDKRNNLIEAGYPDVVVRRIFPEEINHLFIFDGEQLDKFFMHETYENVKNAILDITQIDFLDSAIKHLRDVSRFYKRESPSDSDPLLDELQNGIKNCETNINSCNAQLDENKIELETVRNKLSQINQDLKGINAPEAQNLISKKEEKTDKMKEAVSSLESLEKDSFNNLLDTVPTVFCKSKIENAIKLIDEKYESGTIPPNIKIEFIDKLINKNKKCICGTELKKGSIALKNVMIFKNLAPISEYEPDIRECQSELKSFIKDISNFKENRQHYFNQIGEKKSLILQLSSDIEEINKQLQGMDNDKIKSLTSQQEFYTNELSKYSRNVGYIENQLREFLKRKSEWEDRWRKEQLKSIKNEETLKKLKICDDSIEFLEKSKTELISEVRESINSLTSDLFLNTIRKSTSRFDKVEITEDYECKIISSLGENVIDQLSAGQREILALAFMVALRQESGFDSPIIIDTPIARIDEEKRYESLNLMLKILKGKQVTFLMIPKIEYTDSVKEILKNDIGKLIELSLEKDKKTGMDICKVIEK